MINSHSGSVQVHLGKNQTDSKVFLDFRLGILVDDFLLMFKNKYSDEILAISIPKEFASKFVVSSTVPKKLRHKLNALIKKRKRRKKQMQFMLRTHPLM